MSGLAFTSIRAVAAPLPIANVNTEVISPKELMRAVTRKGLSWGLFRPYRFDENGAENPHFILNREPWRRAGIIVSLDNFGCGSSREHAVWALADFGIRCIVAVSFADIFLNNCLKNRLLAITLPRADIDALLAEAERGAEMDVDLDAKIVTLADGRRFPFDLDDMLRHRLLDGTDDISETLGFVADIETFEENRLHRMPWLARCLHLSDEGRPDGGASTPSAGREARVAI
jgi:3-isopropylmalate/(R)-2-methylmalate dehydratase small subunit